MATERISNEYEPPDGKRCLQRSPAGKGTCFAREGHEGDHVPWSGPRTAYFPAWSQDGVLREAGARPVIAGKLAPYEPDSARWCRAVRDGYTCLAAKGHEFDHAAYYGAGAGYALAWPQDAPAPAKPARKTTAKPAAKPVVPVTARQAVTSAMTLAASAPGMNAGIKAMMTRKARFASETAARLAGIAVMPAARAMLDDAITAAWARRGQSALDESVTYPEVIIGGGLHAAVYSAVRAAQGYVPPVVLERGARPGGTFGMTAAPVFYLNSGNRPGLGGTPGRGEALNYLPGAPVQPADISLSEYQDNSDIGWIIRVTLAMHASVYRNCAVTSVTEDGATVKVEVNGATAIRAARVIDARGPGNPNAMAAGCERVMTFPGLMSRYGTPFPLDGMTRVAVIGGGDSGKCAVEALLGIGPSRGMTVASLDYVPQVDWYAAGLPATCKDWRREIRGRYARIGGYLKNGRLTMTGRRAAAVMPAGDSVLVNARPYSHVITCTGYYLPRLGESTGIVMAGDIARKSPLGELYRVGPAAQLNYSGGEYPLGYVGRAENKVAIFRLAPRTAALAAMLGGEKMPDPPKPARRPAPETSRARLTGDYDRRDGYRPF